MKASVSRYAAMFAALGNDARLRIMRLLLAAHPDGMVVGDIQTELRMPGSTLSHHLERLKQQGLVEARRESTFLRYTARTDSLHGLLDFLYAECCTRSGAIQPDNIVFKIERNPTWTSKKS
jgi:ArsR family transcriptional regulator, arsenate/arsenite/antimonite-responsive transcriptional repressor